MRMKDETALKKARKGDRWEKAIWKAQRKMVRCSGHGG